MKERREGGEGKKEGGKTEMKREGKEKGNQFIFTFSWLVSFNKFELLHSRIA